jgi:hypothetical protein
MRKLLLGALILLASAGNAFASFIVYDAKTAFTTGNVSVAFNPPWSYGYSNVSAGAMTAFTTTNYYNDAKAFGFRVASDYTPGVFKTNQANFPYAGAAVGTFAMHSGGTIATEFAVLRFTAQTAGLYNLNVKWFAGDSLPDQSRGRVSVFVNQNNATLASDIDTLVNGSYASVGSISLNAGDYFELRVGRGSDDYSYDTTPVEMTVTAVPEPGSLAVVSGLVAGLSVLSRRRRQG